MPKEIIIPSEKQITLPIRRFMEEYVICEPNVDGARARQINPIDALIIEASKTGFAHIQWEDFDGKKLDKPLLWWKNSWDKTYFKHIRDKEQQAAERKEWNLLHENTKRIAISMAKKFGVDNHEIFMKAAYKISKAKLSNVAEQMGTKLDKG